MQVNINCKIDKLMLNVEFYVNSITKDEVTVAEYFLALHVALRIFWIVLAFHFLNSFHIGLPISLIDNYWDTPRNQMG